jgi:hypothetical protein
MFQEESDNDDGNTSTTASLTESEDSSIEYARAKSAFEHFVEGYDGRLTLDRLREGIEQFPEIDIGRKLFKHDALHRYIGNVAPMPPEGGRRNNEEWPAGTYDLELVKYLIELAPDALNKVDDGKSYITYEFGKGALPLHLACINADCPTSIIHLLLEKNPSAINRVWHPNFFTMPLHCYLARARIHQATGHWDHENEFFEEDSSALPTGDLDIHTVGMLIDAHPDALTYNLNRSPLHILCEGCGVTFELMKRLIDR